MQAPKLITHIFTLNQTFSSLFLWCPRKISNVVVQTIHTTQLWKRKRGDEDEQSRVKEEYSNVKEENLRVKLCSFIGPKVEDVVIEEQNNIEECSLVIPSHATEEDPTIKLLTENGCTELYHFTDKTNVDSIRNVGLLSNLQLKDTEIPITYFSDVSSRKKDAENSLDDYIHLSFIPYSPMSYSKKYDNKNLKEFWFKVNLEALRGATIKFSNKNGVKSDAIISSDAKVVPFGLLNQVKEIFKNQNRNLYFKGLPEDQKNAMQAEVLVKSKIDTKFLQDYLET